jgi:hypothetical protein
MAMVFEAERDALVDTCRFDGEEGGPSREETK